MGDTDHSRKLHLVNWKAGCRPKKCGGLGGCFVSANQTWGLKLFDLNTNVVMISFSMTNVTMLIVVILVFSVFVMIRILNFNSFILIQM